MSSDLCRNKPIRFLGYQLGLMGLLFYLGCLGQGWCWNNTGFETGDLSGWIATLESHVTVELSEYPVAAVVTPGIALNSSTLNMVHSGNYAVQLYSGYLDSSHYDFARIEQTDVVPAGNTCISLWFAAVLNTYHQSLNAPYGEDTYVLFELLVDGTLFYSRRYSSYDNTGELIDDGYASSYWKTLPWTRYYYDLSAYVGHQVTVRLTAYDCNQSGHYSYGYLDDVTFIPISQMPTYTPTYTITSTPTNTSTMTLTPTLTPTPTTTNTKTPTFTPSFTLTATSSFTSTFTPTFTQTFTPTSTPTFTSTPTPTVTNTPTPTQTPLGPLRLWPNPFNPSTAVRGTLKCADMPEGTALTIYSVSGESVFDAEENGYRVEWDGRTKGGKIASPGVYYYVIRRGKTVLLKGVLLIDRSS